MNMIVLTGMPASGKSTVAAKLADALSLPVLAKDEFKEALFDTIGFSCYAEKRKLDHAANAVLLRAAEAMLRSGQSVILDNNFDGAAAEALNALTERMGARCVTVFFGGDTEAFYRRYVERDRLHLRHLGHVVQEHYPLHEGDSPDHDMTREEFREKFEKRGMADVRLNGIRIEIDATEPAAIDTDRLIQEIRTVLQSHEI
ncbi:MAG: AAA family ATPase [Clostridia bacterium]|nr:AAA family ATPase [Clostridia bacterium]